MKNKKGFILSTYVYILLVFFLLLLGTMLAVLNNTKLLSNKLKDKTQQTSGLVDKDFSFVLLGDKEIIVRVNEEYRDPGFKAQTKKGEDLKDYVKVENNVNINKIGDYEVIYKLTYNGVTRQLIRNVKVADNIGVNYLNTLYQYKQDENGLIIDDTEDENLRYAGSNDDVKNYVEFGNTGELWRIIGVFDTQTEIDRTKSPRIKLIRNESLLRASWDSSASDINSGHGINQWGEVKDENGNVIYEGADLMRLLNGYYIGTEATCTYCGNLNQSTCSNSCSTSVKPLNANSLKMLDSVIWQTGGTLYLDPMPRLTMYENERNDQYGKRCTAGTEKCNDSVERTLSWKGQVGLIYPSDYGYASTNTGCKENMMATSNTTCKNNNWLRPASGYYWPIISGAFGNSAVSIWLPGPNGLSDYYAYDYNIVRPSVYLNPNVKITSGDGTETNPYKLDL